MDPAARRQGKETLVIDSTEAEARDGAVAALDRLFEPFNRSDAPGVVVGVARHGRTLYRRGFGLASVQHGLAVTPATRMRIGSTTKHFTCLAAMLLHEEGRLDVDALATQALPEFRSPGPVPTLRQFMQHTSGLRCSLELGLLANGLAPQPKGWQVQRLQDQQGMNFPPMQAQMYCNGGYHLLSMAIDRAAGMPFERFLRERVLWPVGLFDTECMPSDLDLLPHVATSHVPTAAGGWRIGHFPTDEIRGEGSLVSTVDDMLRWLRHMNGPRQVGSAQTWHDMLTPPTLANGLRSNYALGLYVHDYRGVRVVHHAGGVIGGNSQMITVPSHGLDIVLMANGAACNAIEHAFRVIDLLLPEALGPERRMMPLAGFEHLAGRRYHGASGSLISFGKVKDDRLGLGLNHMPPLPILWEAGDAAQAGFEDVALGPLRFVARELAAHGDGVAPERLRWRESGNEETLQRVADEPLPIEQAPPGLEGRYRCEDLAADAQILREGEALTLVLRGDYGAPRRLRVEVYAPTACALTPLDGQGAGCAMTLEPSGDRVAAFRLDSTRARHLRFTRVE